MIEIKLLFFILGSFFLLEQPNLFAEKVKVYLDPVKKEVRIEQYGLLSSEIESDIAKTEEYRKIKNNQVNWVKETDSFTNKRVEWHLSDKEPKLVIHFNYSNPADLEAMGIYAKDDEVSVFEYENMKILAGKPTEEENFVTFNNKELIAFELTFPVENFVELKDGKKLIRNDLRGKPLFGRKSDDFRGKLFQVAENKGQFPTAIKNGNTFLLDEESNKVTFDDDNKGIMDFLDNNQIRVQVGSPNSKTAPFHEGDQIYSYELDNLQLKLTPITKGNQPQKNKEFYYFVVIN